MDIGKDAGALAREKRDYQRSVTTRLNRSTVVYAIIIHKCFKLACIAPLSGLGAPFPFFSRPYSKAKDNRSSRRIEENSREVPLK